MKNREKPRKTKEECRRILKDIEGANHMKKLLIAITVVLWIIFLFFYGLLFINKYTSYNLYYNTSGESMIPTIREGYVLISKDVPFEDLQVGDIISFRMRKDHGKNPHACMFLKV